MIAHKKKGSGQFMHISNKNTEYSRYENFDLTRMFNKQSFCDSNIPKQPRLTTSESFSSRIQKLNASIFCSFSKKSRDSGYARNNRFVKEGGIGVY